MLRTHQAGEAIECVIAVRIAVWKRILERTCARQLPHHQGYLRGLNRGRSCAGGCGGYGDGVGAGLRLRNGGAASTATGEHCGEGHGEAKAKRGKKASALAAGEEGTHQGSEAGCGRRSFPGEGEWFRLSDGACGGEDKGCR